jgi:hypothetical protein
MLESSSDQPGAEEWDMDLKASLDLWGPGFL